MWILNQVIATFRRLYFSWKIVIENKTDIGLLDLAEYFGDSPIGTYKIDAVPTVSLSLSHIAGGIGSLALLVRKSRKSKKP